METSGSTMDIMPVSKSLAPASGLNNVQHDVAASVVSAGLRQPLAIFHAINILHRAGGITGRWLLSHAASGNWACSYSASPVRQRAWLRWARMWSARATPQRGDLAAVTEASGRARSSWRRLQDFEVRPGWLATFQPGAVKPRPRTRHHSGFTTDILIEALSIQAMASNRISRATARRRRRFDLSVIVQVRHCSKGDPKPDAGGDGGWRPK